ncbi:translation protein SH3-like domain-containing protein [Pavlovales sp. CCMP2436]|nr:translation protein SH3-like domain-containing protein [Pavlovales sp. CCMP2436]|mmetsp:Transcript_12183/g.30652  ORF Transcript_12183/g.30652 Transcript_12183/m.30652 type:complete len:227 (-) Transcript_12183:180-860(-)
MISVARARFVLGGWAPRPGGTLWASAARLSTEASDVPVFSVVPSSILMVKRGGRNYTPFASPVPTRVIAESGSAKVSGFKWGPLKQRGGFEWITEQSQMKRGRKLMTQLMLETRVELFAADSWRSMGHFRSGDAVAVRYVYNTTQEHPNIFRGICVGTKRNGYASGFWVRNVVAGEEVLAHFKSMSPLVKGVDVVKVQMIETRRNKLTYLKGKLAKYVKTKTLKQI